MNTLMIISVLIFAAFVAAVCVRSRVWPDSVSDTARLTDWPLRALWYVTAAAAVVCSAPALVDSTSENWQFLAFIVLAAATLCIVSTYSSDIADRRINMITAIVFYIAAEVLIGVSRACWLMVLPVGVSVWAVFSRDRHAWLWLTVATAAALMLYALIL